MNRYRAYLLIGSAALAVFTIGCSEPPPTRFPVAGKVVIDGQPLTSGSIQFVPEGGRPFAGKIQEDGSFRLSELSVSEKTTSSGVAKGKYRIGVSSSQVLNEDAEKIHRNVPPHYADFRTSGLEAEITKEEDNLVIELTWGETEGNEDSTATSEDSTETSEDGEDSDAAARAAEQPPQATEAEQE